MEKRQFLCRAGHVKMSVVWALDHMENVIELCGSVNGKHRCL